ncbi:serine hydrolase [Sphingomonas sp. RT2P30]|uniref:serine hydrolase n=1 Tax=Parasphingomonas halimpatiens TaxID=3096162 RepID=UPI002FC72CBB
MSEAVRISRRALVTGASLGTLAALAPSTARAAPLALNALDSTVSRFMAAFDIPGAAVAIVQPGREPILRPYGVRKLGASERVDIHTQFAIASNSKAFLSASLALLVDQKKLRWDDLVTKHIPEFRMHDPAVTALMTVRDLLVHNSGLPLGAGDLMQVPPTDHSAADMLAALPHFKPATPFRSAYAYDNILYIVAGIVLQRVSGLTWDEYVPSRIFAPLGMIDAVTNTRLMTGPNIAARHARLGPPTRGLGGIEVVPPSESAVIGPAGGIGVSVAGIVPWLQVQLGKGSLPGGTRLWSEAQAKEMWTPHTIISNGPGPGADHPERSVLSAYGLGWGVADYRGCRMLSHSGGLAGQVTRTTLLPDQGIAFVVYTNCEDGDAVSALRYAIMDLLLGAPAHDWLGNARATRAGQQAQVAALLGSGDFKAPPGGPSQPLDRYAGRYRDPWYGDIVIARNGQSLSIDFTRTPALKSALETFGPDCFRTRFARGAGEDAVVCFDMTGGKVAGVTLKALSPLADFSFDYHDLTLARVSD